MPDVGVRAPPARLVARASVGGGVALLTFDVSPRVRASFTHPGQYAEVIVGSDNGFFVIASDVDAAKWELLMRGGGGAADALLAMPLGTDVTMSSALGEGFPCERAEGRSLVVAVTGTGIAAARPIVALRLARAHAQPMAPTEVYVGVRYAEDVPLADELSTWRAHGVRVTVCLSRADPTARELETGHYARGYVQDVLRARLARGAPWLVFAVGAAGMVDGVRDVARELGAEVRTNY